MTQILVSEEFAAALDSFRRQLKDQVVHKVQLLYENPAHPSLNAHRIRNTDGKWECYVNESYRIIYDRVEEGLRLWKVGSHRIIDRVHYASFASHTQFRRAEWVDHPEEEVAATGDEGAIQTPVRREPGLLEDFPATHLRILGVPADLIRAVRLAPTLEALEEIPGLPRHTVHWLQELLTGPQFEEVLFDPSRLLYRTTLDQLKGYCQGSIQQLMLNLTEDQRQYVDAPRPGITVLKGVAGSGKTTVGVYRAIERAMEGRRVILLTFNRTLAAVTRSLIESLVGPLPENLEVANVDRWIIQFLKERGIDLSPLSEPDCEPLLAEALAEVRETGREAVLEQRVEFFRDEIARVIKGAGITTLEQYLGVARHGRKTALAPQQRRAVWRVYQAYQRKLQAAGVCDWRDPALQAYEQLLKKPLEQPYDDVIVDEGQDLTPVQLRLAQRLMKGSQVPPANGIGRSFFLLGDAAQTIYSRGFAWRQAGIPARGRTFILRKNHRNTRQIAEAAAQLLEHNRLSKVTGEYIAPEWTQRSGAKPIIIECDVVDREVRAVREYLLDLVGDQQFRVSDFAVICPTNELCERVRNDLFAVGLPCALHRDDEFDILEEQVKILTIHSAKGLEFPVVFLVGVREGILPRRPPVRLDDEERELAIERQRTLLYVGMTRAAEALYLVTTTGARSPFLSELGEYAVYTDPFTGMR